MPAIHLRLIVQVADGPVDGFEVSFTGSVRRHQPDIQSMSAKRTVQCLHHLHVEFPMIAEPAVVGADRKLVRRSVVADLGAFALFHQILKPHGDCLGIHVGVKVFGDRRHPARHEIERGAREAESGVVVVGESVHRLLGPVGVSGKQP